MRRIILLAFLSLVACATPREACIAGATKDIRVLDRLIATSQKNLDRGYAIKSEDYLSTEIQYCGEVDGENVYCDVAVANRRDVPVAINLDEEQSKLTSLVNKRAELSKRSDAVVAECKIAHPET